MPAVVITSDKQHLKAMNVLIEVGGPFQGRGPAERPTLVVTNAQYEALVAAGVVKAKGTKARARGKKTHRNGKV